MALVHLFALLFSASLAAVPDPPSHPHPPYRLVRLSLYHTAVSHPVSAPLGIDDQLKLHGNNQPTNVSGTHIASRGDESPSHPHPGPSQPVAEEPPATKGGKDHAGKRQGEGRDEEEEGEDVCEGDLDQRPKNMTACEYYKECPEESLVPYGQLHYCHTQSIPLSLGAGLLWLVYLFMAVGDLADGYNSPLLIDVCDRMGLSEQVAGATFLAFGNAAGDVVLGLSANLTGGDDNLYLYVGMVVGAVLFITLVALGGIIFASPGVFLHPRSLIKDAG
ncbi:unnamed protein product [Vitrella brassicaformis CCMP3155]|uniref:Sodium/calcium exchanger membrane region domain-containing protein n=1 Tax=Vitrella brassicaformis (strain CCMP3155) TaxID=1169540 RepID=A0A0G4EIZ5_VITBC|nr:unnamed protein product [Vitrella brassicaformis CCMP3155]|eukprot:CEL96671.1 unnamed protein product [Vitrella brassicaformis CCMP3155]